jgi:hypothetical protein
MPLPAWATRSVRPPLYLRLSQNAHKQILSGKLPFNELSEPAIIINVAIEGVRPAPPVSCHRGGVYYPIWELLQKCWNTQPVVRPTAAEIVRRLMSPPIGAKPNQSGANQDETCSSKFRRSLQDCPLLPSIPQIERKIFVNGSLPYLAVENLLI